MVVVWVVRLSNESNHSYHMQYLPGFLTEWNAPKVDGSDPPFIVMPGFSTDDIQDFAIPHNGSITIWCENDESNKIEIFVGPRPGYGDDEDWLQFRRSDGEPVGHRSWQYVGPAQMFGGRHVEMQCLFVGPLSAGVDAALNFTPFSATQPNDVLLNVYDLVNHVSSFNGVFSNRAFNLFGFFHAGIEVYGEEWSFYRIPSGECGICRSLKPKHHSVHVFRQTVNLGKTKLTKQMVLDVLVNQLKHEWAGDSYDLLDRNCITFCDAFATSLGVNRCPSWVSNLHESASSITSVFPWLKPYICGESDDEELLEEEEEEGDIHGPADETWAEASESILSESPKSRPSRG